MQTGRVQTEVAPVHIRWMIRRDMTEVLLTEQDSFAQPWTEEDFLHCLRQRNCIGMVAERSEKVVGYVIYELHKTKLHILNLAVHPTARRQKIGQSMISKLLGKLSSHRRAKITLEIRESNLPAQVFFRTQGFFATRVLRSYFEDTCEDAYLMQYLLPGEEIEEEAYEPVNRIVQYED